MSGTGPVVTPDDRRILDALAEAGTDMTATEIVAATGINYDRVGRSLRWMRRNGNVRWLGRRKSGGKWAL